METQALPQESRPQFVSKKVNGVFLWILAAIPLVGMLLGIEWMLILAANILLCVADETQLKKKGYDTKSLGKQWVFLIPIYLYRRAKLLGQKPIHLVVWCLTFALSFIPTGSGNAGVNMVKNGYLDAYPQKTIGTAFEGYMSNVKWESLKANDGSTYVNVSGRITYDGKPAKAIVQYRVYTNGTFEYHAFEIDGVPQNDLMYGVFIYKVYE